MKKGFVVFPKFDTDWKDIVKSAGIDESHYKRFLIGFTYYIQGYENNRQKKPRWLADHTGEAFLYLPVFKNDELIKIFDIQVNSEKFTPNEDLFADVYRSSDGSLWSIYNIAEIVESASVINSSDIIDTSFYIKELYDGNECQLSFVNLEQTNELDRSSKSKSFALFNHKGMRSSDTAETWQYHLRTISENYAFNQDGYLLMKVSEPYYTLRQAYDGIWITLDIGGSFEYADRGIRCNLAELTEMIEILKDFYARRELQFKVFYECSHPRQETAPYIINIHRSDLLALSNFVIRSKERGEEFLFDQANELKQVLAPAVTINAHTKSKNAFFDVLKQIFDNLYDEIVKNYRTNRALMQKERLTYGILNVDRAIQALCNGYTQEALDFAKVAISWLDGSQSEVFEEYLATTLR